VCAFDQTDSTVSSTLCVLSDVSTEYSVSLYAIETPNTLYGTQISSNLSQAAYLVDGNNNIGWTNNSTSKCYFG
jgi:hypothetical protein